MGCVWEVCHVKWVVLRYDPGSERLVVGDHELHCGEPLALRIQGATLRGRVEHDGRGWYWTDNRTSLGLRGGMEAALPEAGKTRMRPLGESWT